MTIELYEALEGYVGNPDPTKQEEIDAYAKLIDCLPAGTYLHSYLAGSLEHFAQCVQSDMVTPIDDRNRTLIDDTIRTEQRLKEQQERLRKLNEAVSLSQARLQNVADYTQRIVEATDNIKDRIGDIAWRSEAVQELAKELSSKEL